MGRSLRDGGPTFSSSPTSPTLPIDDGHRARQGLAKSGKLDVDIPAYDYPALGRNTVKLGRKLTPRRTSTSPRPRAPTQVQRSRHRRHREPGADAGAGRDLQVDDGLVGMDRAQDVCQIALVERHRGTGQVTNGFVSGFGYKQDCAVACTVAHDCHHMIVVGTSKQDMALAANRWAKSAAGSWCFPRARTWR